MEFTKKEILTCLDKNKQNATKTAAELKTTPIILRNRMKKLGIVLEAYAGRKKFTGSSRDSIAEIIKEEFSNGLFVNNICKKYGWTSPFVLTICKEYNITYKSQLDIWEESRLKIRNQIDKFKDENEFLNLKIIAKDNNISLEQLKAELKNINHKTILHGYNKSKGEMEVKEKILDISGYQAVSKFISDGKKKLEIDCIVEQKNFGVEYCGEYWHSFPKLSDKKYHQNKTILARKNGIQLMTIFESEWITKKDIIVSMISSRLGKTDKLMARKCFVKEITNIEAKHFHNKNHIYGYTNSSINFGLFCVDSKILYSVLSLSKSRFDKKYQYEITRYSTLLNFTVVGGFSKIFSAFIKKHKPISVMTYADLRFGFGDVYRQCGFTPTSITPPNYFYYNKNKPVGLESRMKYQKSKLVKLFPYLTGTELEIMTSAKYYRVYDCGSQKYGWCNSELHHP